MVGLRVPSVSEVYKYGFENDTLNKMLEVLGTDTPWIVNGSAGRRVVEAPTAEQAESVYKTRYRKETHEEDIDGDLDESSEI